MPPSRNLVTPLKLFDFGLLKLGVKTMITIMTICIPMAKTSKLDLAFLHICTLSYTIRGFGVFLEIRGQYCVPNLWANV